MLVLPKNLKITRYAFLAILLPVFIALFFHVRTEFANKSKIKSEPFTKIKQSESVVGKATSQPTRRTDFDLHKDRLIIGSKAFLLTANHDTPTGDALTLINNIAPAAESGDADAAFDIYLKISACRDVLDASASEKLLSAFKKTQMEEAVAKKIEDTLEECASIDGRSDLLQKNWLEMAAEHGSLEAKLLYAIDTKASLGSSADMLRDPAKVANYKKKAMSFLNDAANAGSIDALLGLANAYDYGALTNVDPVKAYAYYSAAQRISPNSVSESKLQYYKNKVDRESIRKSESLSRLIYNSCCTN